MCSVTSANIIERRIQPHDKKLPSPARQSSSQAPTIAALQPLAIQQHNPQLNPHPAP